MLKDSIRQKTHDTELLQKVHHENTDIVKCHIWNRKY